MTKIEIVTLSDSLDERIKSNVETVTFFNPLTGEKMEIELGEANRKHFDNHLAKLSKYIDAARVVEAPKPTKAVGAKSDKSAIREWAKANGFEIGERGRIKAEIMEAYEAAQNKTETQQDIVSEPAEDNATEANVERDSETQVTDEPTENELNEIENVAPVTDEELQDMLKEMALSGVEPTLEDLSK